jgi:hypothetical protein
MIKILLIALCLTLFLQANPYKELDSDIKLNLMINYFLNEELKKIVPPKPIEEKMQDDGLSLDPVKYEKYYNYIQRIKAIHDSRAAEQKDINEKYEGKIGFYNGKLKVLKRFYAKEKNLNPLLQISINKAFKVVYGKPVFRNMKYDQNTNTIYGILHIKNIYSIDKFEDKKIEFYMEEKNINKFLAKYDKLKVKVQFDYKENKLYLKDSLFLLNNKEYKVNFTDKINDKIKLDIKINDDIFHLIKI